MIKYILGILLVLSSILIALSLGSCDGNYQNIKVSGTVAELGSGKRISHAKILVRCWAYDMEIWASTSLERTLYSDSNGSFETFFEEGEAIDLIIEAAGYHALEESITLNRSMASFTLYLKKRE